jgi:hypothetical protein
VGLLPPDGPLTGETVVLRLVDERDLATIEEAARDAEIARRFGLAKLSAREHLDAYLGAERSGFQREGVLRSYGEVDGRRVDAVFFSLLPGDLG